MDYIASVHTLSMISVEISWVAPNGTHLAHGPRRKSFEILLLVPLPQCAHTPPQTPVASIISFIFCFFFFFIKLTSSLSASLYSPNARGWSPLLSLSLELKPIERNTLNFSSIAIDSSNWMSADTWCPRGPSEFHSILAKTCSNSCVRFGLITHFPLP